LPSLSFSFHFQLFLEGDAPGSPIEKPRSKSQTKGKWLKLTRKGLLVSALGRVGKLSSRRAEKNTTFFSSTQNVEKTENHFFKYHIVCIKDSGLTSTEKWMCLVSGHFLPLLKLALFLRQLENWIEPKIKL